MLGRAVPLQVPGAGEPPAAAVNRAPQLLPWLPGVVEAEQVSGWARRTSRQGMQISTVNRPSISLKGPVKVPQKEQCGPHSAPPISEPVFDKQSSAAPSREARPAGVAEALLVSMGGCIASALTDWSAVEGWVRSWGLSAAEQDEVWARWRRGSRCG